MKFSILLAMSIAASLALFQQANSKEIRFEAMQAEPRSVSVPKRVTIENYDLADSQLSINASIAFIGSIGKISSLRGLPQIINPVQPVVRMNRDTVYSFAVFDLNSPVTIEMPPSNGRYMSLHVNSEENYSLGVLYADKERNTKVKIELCKALNEKCNPGCEGKKCKKILSDTRYIMVIVRILIDPLNPNELQIANELTASIKVSQASIGQFTLPNYNLRSLIDTRRAVAALLPFVEPATPLNGYKGQIDPTVHLIGTATLLFGLPGEDAIYNIIYPPNTTQETIFTIRIKDAPVMSNAFWSLTVYNAEGFLQPNPAQSFSVNSFSGVKEADGSYVVYFSNQRENYMTNWIYTFPGWNCMLRLYRPTDDYENWTLPTLNQIN